MDKIYYKVVSSDSYRKQFYSAVINYGSDLLVKYKVGKWVEGRYPLFIFSSLTHAQNFVMYLTRLRSPCIFECSVKNPRPTQNVAYFLHDCKKYWSGEGVTLVRSPEGTLIADKVKLTRLIYDEQEL